MIHPIAKNLGYKSNADFYRDFDTKEKYEAYMQNGGQINVEQNQALPQDYTVDNHFKNVKEERRTSYNRPRQSNMTAQSSGYGDIPQILKTGGNYTWSYPNSYNVGGMIEMQSPREDVIYQDGGEVPISEQLMKKGGQPKLSLKQQKMLIQTVQQQAQQLQQLQQQSQGQQPAQQQMQTQQSTQMKSGGIHIKKSHEGRFTEYKKRTGKTTEEALHSKDPHVRQMANFARNASKWSKKQLGGIDDSSPIAGATNVGTTNTSAFAPIQNTVAGNTDQNINSAETMNSVYKPVQNINQNNPYLGRDLGNIDQQNQPVKQKSNFPGYALGIGSEVLGLAAGIGAAATQNQRTRNNLGQQRNMGMTSSQYPEQQTLGAKGDYGVTGSMYGQTPQHFSYGNLGNFQQPQMQVGGMLRDYQIGQEYDLPDHEIENLKKQGYKFKIIK